MKKIVAAGGIDRRHSVAAGPTVSAGQFLDRLDEPGERGRLWEQGATDMAINAAKVALNAWKRGSASDITHVVVHSCTGFAAPGLDFHLITSLGLPSGTRKIGCNFMGCFGAFTSLFVAKQIIEADTTGKAVVLVVCAEACSLHMTREPKLELIVGNTIFADGAAAAIVTRAGFDSVTNSSGGSRSRVQKSLYDVPAKAKGVDLTGTPVVPGNNDSGHFEWAIGAMASEIIPDSAHAMTWRQSADGGRYDMFLDRSIPKSLSSIFISSGISMLHKVGISNPWGCAWAIHPGGKAILTAFQDSLAALRIKGEGIECSLDVLRRHGNMSSPTILFVLQQALSKYNDASSGSGGVKAKDNVFMAGFGPGLTVEYGRMHRVKVGAAHASGPEAAAGASEHALVTSPPQGDEGAASEGVSSPVDVSAAASGDPDSNSSTHAAEQGGSDAGSASSAAKSKRSSGAAAAGVTSRPRRVANNGAPSAGPIAAAAPAPVPGDGAPITRQRRGRAA